MFCRGVLFCPAGVLCAVVLCPVVPTARLDSACSDVEFCCAAALDCDAAVSFWATSLVLLLAVVAAAVVSAAVVSAAVVAVVVSAAVVAAVVSAAAVSLPSTRTTFPFSSEATLV